MKVHSLTILHYGADYLPYALRSIYHSVDQCHVFYTPSPSHGHQTNIPPIETKDELQTAAYAYNPDNKIRWYDMIGVTREGPHRDLALQTVQAAGADLVVVVDCDEIWEREQLELALIKVWETNDSRIYRINMIHFWRSFDLICRDDGWPERIIDLRQASGYRSISREIGQVFHFGYAVTDKVMRYKWQIHGHKNELRPGWLEDIWPAWPPVDNCHPTNGLNERGEAFWTPEPFDKTELPAFMRAHPFYGVDKIE